MKDVNEYLEQAINGQSQISPEERRKYLGQLKERLYLSATFTDSNNENFFNNLEAIIRTKNATLYINDKLPSNVQNKLIQLALKYNRSFTVITNQNKSSADSICLVYADKTATHIPNCAYDIQFTSSNEVKKDDDTPTKSSLWDKLFHHHH